MDSDADMFRGNFDEPGFIPAQFAGYIHRGNDPAASFDEPFASDMEDEFVRGDAEGAADLIGDMTDEVKALLQRGDGSAW